MADGNTNRDLSHEAAEALLTAIKEAAPGAERRSTDGLESLAKAYAAVVDAMPSPPTRPGRVVTS